MPVYLSPRLSIGLPIPRSNNKVASPSPRLEIPRIDEAGYSLIRTVYMRRSTAIDGDEYKV